MEDYSGIIMEGIYWDASDETFDRNTIQNYTYVTDPAIASTDAYVYLYCGGDEPYAIKSHEI